MRLPTILTRTTSDANATPRGAEIPTATITPSSPVSSLSEQNAHPPSPRPLAFKEEPDSSRRELDGLQPPVWHRVVSSVSSPDLRDHPPEAPTAGDVSPSGSDGVLFEKPSRRSPSPGRRDGRPHSAMRHAHFEGSAERDSNLLTVDYARQGYRPDHLVLDMGEQGNGFDRAKSPTPSSHAPPQNFSDLTVLYNVVAERRNAFDALLWSVVPSPLSL